MYYSLNPSQGNSLSNRDKATIRKLYAMQADIQNNQQLSTGDTQSYYQLVDAAVEKQKAGRHGDAITLYRKALTINSSDPDLYFNLGLAYWKVNNTDNAIYCYRKVLQYDRNRIEAKFNLATLLLNSGVDLAHNQKLTDARSHFKEAVTLFEEVAHTPNAPSGTQENLALARKNLALVSS